MKKSKDYDVEVYRKGSNDLMYRWILNACGVERAIDFAMDILAEMTYKELDGEERDIPIGYDKALRRFRVTARMIRT